jgi:hypothetical protein
MQIYQKSSQKPHFIAKKYTSRTQKIGSRKTYSVHWPTQPIGYTPAVHPTTNKKKLRQHLLAQL